MPVEREISKSRQIIFTKQVPINPDLYSSTVFDELTPEEKTAFNIECKSYLMQLKDIVLSFGVSQYKYAAWCIEYGDGGRCHAHGMLWAHKDAKTKSAWMTSVPFLRSENMDVRCCKGTANDSRIYLKKGSVISKDEYYAEWTDGKKAAHRHPAYGTGEVLFWEAGTPPDAEAHKKGIQYMVNILQEFGASMLDPKEDTTDEYNEILDCLKYEIINYVDSNE